MVSTQRGKPQNSQPTSFSSTSTSSSSSGSSSSGRIQRSRSRVLLGRRTREDLRHEEADAELIVMRINRCENFPNGSLMTLRCPPEVHLETARKIIKEAAPRLRLPDPSTYVEMVHEARRLAIREEWRTIFEFYVKTVPPEQLGLLTGASSSLSGTSPPASNSIPSSIPSAPNCQVASSSSFQPPSNSEDAPSSSNASLPSEMENVPSNIPSADFAQQNRQPELAVSNPPVPHVVTNRDVAFLSSHRTNSVVAPANLTIQTDSYTGSLLFVKRFRFSDTQSPRPLRTRLERGLIVDVFEITDHARAFKITTKEAYDYTVLTSEEFDLYVAIVRRLDEAEKYYSDDDIEEMKSMILDPEASCVKTESGEYCYFTKISCGSLHMLAIEQPLYVREECQRYFNTLVRFVAFCHALGIVLVDISLRRFIFDDRDRSRLRMRCFTDVLVMETPTASDKVKSKFGCPAYIAPEVLLPEPHGGMKADIWSLGIILFVLVTGRFPFSDVTARGLLNKVKRAKVEIPPTAGNLSPQVRSLIFGLLQRHPRDRPSADLLKNLPWINGRERLVNASPPRALPRNMKIEEDDLNLHYEMDTPLPYPNNFLDLSLSGRAPSLFTHQSETISPCMACKALGHSDHKMLDIFGG